MHKRPYNWTNDHEFTSSEQRRWSECRDDDYDFLENGQLWISMTQNVFVITAHNFLKTFCSTEFAMI
jgi:hypothetical protein